MFLMTRVRGESVQFGTRAGILRGMAVTRRGDHRDNTMHPHPERPQRPTPPTSPDGSHGQPPQPSVATNGRAPIPRPIQDAARG